MSTRWGNWHKKALGPLANFSKINTIETKNFAIKITKKGYDSCFITMLPVGAVLISSHTPIVHLAITEKELCTNQGFKSLVPNNSLHSFYLYQIFKKQISSPLFLSSMNLQSLLSRLKQIKSSKQKETR
ncbi:MAG: restriction endonuclease subunit S [Candidatus Schekmanbacteria bacterium]|nr:restriction endonuclease subunit S [Candidatus Schekmanbacteria bacterium]